MSRFVKENRWWAIEETTNPDTRVYHTRTRLLDDQQVVGALQGAQRLTAQQIGFELNPLVVLLLEIRGVTAVEVRAHCFSVNKAAVYSWDEIEDPIMSLLYGVKQAECFSAGSTKEEKTR